MPDTKIGDGRPVDKAADAPTKKHAKGYDAGKNPAQDPEVHNHYPASAADTYECCPPSDDWNCKGEDAVSK